MITQCRAVISIFVPVIIASWLRTTNYVSVHGYTSVRAMSCIPNTLGPFIDDKLGNNIQAFLVLWKLTEDQKLTYLILSNNS